MVLRAWAPWLLALTACAGEVADTDIGVPVDTSSAVVEDTDPFPVDTSEVALNEEPEHTVQLIEQGTWSLSPIGGPYTSLVGTLNIIEYIDGPPEVGDTDPPPCQVSISLTGTPSEVANCPGCAFTFDVLHEVVSGDLSMCNDPARPFAGQVRRMGFHAGTNRIQWQHGNFWFDWYQATQAGDQVTFSYTTTVGISKEDDN
ncbi:MAG: hypothetical protein KC912_07025 [Proteobacteria bacterium]|nr:hypothetical protein [Pseudomonadota bacterium]